MGSWIEKINSEIAALDVAEYNRLAAPGTVRKMRNLRGSLNRLNRRRPPLRGFAIKYFSQPDIILKFLKDHEEALNKTIKSSPFVDEAKSHIFEWENFQSKQKGPAAPVNYMDVYPDIIKPLQNKKLIVFNNYQTKVLNQVIDEWYDYLKDIKLPRINNIQFSAEWAKLPNDTVRGFPYCTIGKNIDEQIISEGGDTYQSALSYFKLATQNICFPGWRIQGKPAPDKPKLRLVTIPSVYYQYMVNGLVNPLVEGLKNYPCFAGWAEPSIRWNVMSNGVVEADKDGYIQLQLDYSKYDQSFPPQARLAIWKLMLSLYADPDKENELYKRLYQYQTKQFLFIGDPSKGNSMDAVSTLPLPMQLLSGVKDTQITGSLWNGVLMGIIAHELGYKLPHRYCRMLGDDAVLPVAKAVFDKYGYEGVLGKISDILLPYGFEVNPKKAYPNSDVAFLQKLYVPSYGIRGIGSVNRALRSFYYRENFPKKIPGIKSLEYMEIISQISILSEATALDGNDLREFFKYFADFWMLHDDFLYLAVDEARSKQADANYLFRNLIARTGATLEQILDFNDALSYDHNAMTSKLHSSDYGKTFPILNPLLESDVKRQISQENLHKINSVRASQVISGEDDSLDSIATDQY